MELRLLETIEPLVYDMAEQIYELLDSNTLSKLKQQLADMRGMLGDYCVSLEMNLIVDDFKHENRLPLVQCVLETSDGKPPRLGCSDFTFNRYLADGELVIVPHDLCPICWGTWLLKFTNPTCPECGVEMGKQVKQLIDSDCCLFCEKGKMEFSNPKCVECGCSVDPSYVTWG